MTRVLGIDPGIASTGFGIVQKDGDLLELINYGVIKTLPNLNIPERLNKLYSELSDLMDKNKTDYVAVERLFFNTNLKTVINVSEAKGVIMLAVSKYYSEVFEYTPSEAKKALLGAGRATKKEVQYAIMNIFKMDRLPRPDDAADGIALALCHIYTIPYLEKAK
ncbi:MAG: crossover junction endodeoxyribonuclease RuvC [Caldisericota bacterium]|nr:crossover junction endodeoxyribonuclease RuvC [Caldisericota bacterium]